MRRGFVLLAFAAAVAALGADAQPVAKLEVVASAKAPSQHTRIEQKLDQVLELLRAAPPPPPVVVPPVVTPPPVVVPPVVTPPAAVNPFLEWCAKGYDQIYIATWILHRSINAAEFEQARAAGCKWAAAPPLGGGGGGGPAEPVLSSHDLGEGGGRVTNNVFHTGQAQTFAYTVLPGTKRARIQVFGQPGRIASATDHRGTVTFPASLAIHVYEMENPMPGQHRYTVAVVPDGQPSMNVGVQFEQW